MAQSLRSRLVDAGLIVLLAGLGASSLEAILALRAHQRIRRDLAQLQDVSHGLLDPEAWIDQVSGIIESKIEHFELTPEVRRELKPILERTLDALMTKADEQMRQKRSAPALEDRIEEEVREKLLSVDTLKAGIPGDVDAILDQSSQPATRHELKQVLRRALKNISKETFSTDEEAGRLEAIHQAYGCADQGTCEEALKLTLDANHTRALEWTATTLALAFLVFAGVRWGTRPSPQRRHLILLVVACGLLLACGVLTPMLDVEARISRLSFVLLGEPVEFQDQVLYFQSKSVLDVVRVLTATGKPDMILVGGLLVTFSVFFPIAKLIASTIYLFDLAGLRKRALVRFFALKSSKWSMADVFVVAMFMAYIGFNGVVDSELKAFTRAAEPTISVLTTNGSSLSAGLLSVPGLLHRRACYLVDLRLCHHFLERPPNQRGSLERALRARSPPPRRGRSPCPRTSCTLYLAPEPAAPGGEPALRRTGIPGRSVGRFSPESEWDRTASGHDQDP